MLPQVHTASAHRDSVALYPGSDSNGTGIQQVPKELKEGTLS